MNIINEKQNENGKNLENSLLYSHSVHQTGFSCFDTEKKW